MTNKFTSSYKAIGKNQVPKYGGMIRSDASCCI